MPKGREELRRGVRGLVEAASREMHALVEEAAALDDRPPAAPEQPSASAEPERVPAVEAGAPLLRLVRDPPRPGDAPGGPTVPEAAGSVPIPAAGPVPIPETVHPSRGVCAAYLVNPSCWEVPDAYCNQALQVCMLRACPVFSLHRKEMERRFAAKFAHLW